MAYVSVYGNMSVGLNDLASQIIDNFTEEQVVGFLLKIANHHNAKEDIFRAFAHKSPLMKFNVTGSSAFLDRNGIRSIIAFLKSPKCDYEKAIIYESGMVEFV